MIIHSQTWWEVTVHDWRQTACRRRRFEGIWRWNMKVCDHIKGCRHAKNNYLSGRTDVGFSALTRSAAFFGEFAFISVLVSFHNFLQILACKKKNKNQDQGQTKQAKNTINTNSRTEKKKLTVLLRSNYSRHHRNICPMNLSLYVFLNTFCVCKSLMATFTFLQPSRPVKATRGTLLFTMRWPLVSSRGFDLAANLYLRSLCRWLISGGLWNKLWRLMCLRLRKSRLQSDHRHTVRGQPTFCFW